MQTIDCENTRLREQPNYVTLMRNIGVVDFFFHPYKNNKRPEVGLRSQASHIGQNKYLV